MKLAAIVVLAACGGSAAKPPVEPPVVPATKSAIDPAAHLETVSEEIGFLTPDSSNVPGTLVRPGVDGKYPAIVVFAGSGPTDRDWNNPLIKTTNGSGKLLAEALAAHGAVVVRFDKAGTGANTTKLTGKTIDVYVDEMRAALSYLRARPDVDTTHLYVAGHSEGGIHAMRTAIAEGDHVAGLLLLSASGRTLEDILIAQITAQVEEKAPGQSAAILGPFKKALDDFAAGQTIDPKSATPIPGLQVLLGALTAIPELGRGLLTFDPVATLPKVTVPIFIYNGQHDIQVDATIDAPKLEAAAKSTNKNVTMFLAPDADHVLKHEVRPVAELRKDLAGVAEGYNAADRNLDEATVTAIVAWLANH
ncbi:MAG: alpha/beta fold hydrolase [Kofleriaceae bacterium]